MSHDAEDGTLKYIAGPPAHVSSPLTLILSCTLFKTPTTEIRREGRTPRNCGSDTPPECLILVILLQYGLLC